MRKEIVATLLISAIWAIAGFLTAYSAWEMGISAAGFSQYVEPRLPDPFGLGILAGVIALILTFVILRVMLPSRATQRRRLIHLLDEIGVDDLDAIQRKLSAVSSEDNPDELDRGASLRALLQEEKRKHQLDDPA